MRIERLAYLTADAVSMAAMAASDAHSSGDVLGLDDPEPINNREFCLEFAYHVRLTVGTSELENLKTLIDMAINFEVIHTKEPAIEPVD